MKIDWRQKLSSRKLWAAVIAVVVSVCAIFGVNELTTQQLSALITAVGALIAYIIGEGWVDGMRAKNGTLPGENAANLSPVECERKKDAAREKGKGYTDEWEEEE